MRILHKAARQTLTAMVLSGLLLQSACSDPSAASPSATDPAATEPGATPDTDGKPETNGIPAEGIVLASQSAAAPICYDAGGEDADGIVLAANAVAGDFALLTGTEPQVLAVAHAGELPADPVLIIAGTLGDPLIASFGLSWDIKPSLGDMASEEWERYQIKVVEENGQTRVIVAGSDKRGTIYGLFYLSQDLGGVSPWVWWADVKPSRVDTLRFSKEELETLSKTPSVKYRGIFLNDEAPSLSSFVSNQFGNYNYLFYANVFELILRLKGNYLWPAMWGNAFSEEGISGLGTAQDIRNLNKLAKEERDSLANAALADHYGIVMGLSHHEPMMRAGVEWQNLQRSNPPTYDKPTQDNADKNLWNYFLNRDNIYDFWVDGFNRNKSFEQLVPIGMRGEADSALRNPDGTPFTLAQNIELLKNVITDQKEILAAAGHAEDTQVLALYKEVEKYWYGNASTPGLNQMEELTNDIIVLCEDNNNFLRTLPKEEERDRLWGLYYHFDYNGGPRTYMWLNVTPLERVWDNMTMAYDYGVDDLWIVNVGDLKPMELPISYFLDLAYDFETHGTTNPNKTGEYTEDWVRRQFSAMNLSDDQITDIAGILTGYVDLNGRKRPETIFADTFSVVHYNEAQIELDKAIRLEEKADEYLALFEGTEDYDAFYQLVYYPAAAVATVNKMWLYAGLNEFYAKHGSMLANLYAGLVEETLERDKALMETYNRGISGGYWRGMMNQVNHTGYTAWNHESATYPSPRRVQPARESELIVTLQGSDKALRTGEGTLPDFESVLRQQYALTLSNSGSEALSYRVEVSDDWILTETGEGSLHTAKTLCVGIDWSKVTADAEGLITIIAGEQTVNVAVRARVPDMEGLAPVTHIASNGAVSILANNYADKAPAADGTEWIELADYGKFDTTMKMAPSTVSFAEAAEGPYLDYKVYVPAGGSYTLFVYVGASNNRYYDEVFLRFGVQIDGEGDISVKNTITANYVSGDSNEWSNSILYAGRIVSSKLELAEGEHSIRIYGVDAGLLLEKLVLVEGSIKKSFFGPPESYYTGKEITDGAFVWHQLPDEKQS